MIPYRFDLPTRTTQEKDFLSSLGDAAVSSHTTNVERFMHFPLWAPRQAIARFLAQWEIYKLISEVHGSIVECGVAFGGGLMAWAHFVSIVEPYAHTRRVIGFDTFQGFPRMSEHEKGAESGLAEAGAMAVPLDGEIAALARLHDLNRPVGHIPRVELVKGDACETIQAYVKKNEHLVVAALVLDFDIFEPTAAALRWLLPLMPVGGVVVFDEVNCKDWPGETAALRASGLWQRGKLRRCAHTSTMSYVVLE